MQPIVLTDLNEKFTQLESVYSFKGVGQRYYWPTKNGQGLGRAGMWNFLWRLGYHPLQLNLNQLPNPSVQSPLFVDKTLPMTSQMVQGLKNWLQKGGTIIATGELLSWREFLPNVPLQTCKFDSPYAGMAYVFDNQAPELIAPSQWSFIEFDKPYAYETVFGNIAAIAGERQTPARATILTYQAAPAIIQSGSFYYLNGHPFAALQAWLQGQENLYPWLGWRHRFFWLDEWISSVFDVMLKHRIIKCNESPSGINKLNKTTVILRHDLDYSRDVSFLSEENRRDVQATYALLKDKNTKFWLQELRQFKQHEIAFHYNTGKRNWQNLIHRVFNKKNISASFLPDRNKIAQHGLARQIRWAKSKGITVSSIHRHLAYLIYPEFIDALDNVFEANLGVMGSSSLFRGQVFKWGSNHLDGYHSYLGEWPDNQFPISYPFRLAHASKSGKILRGWELTSLMDVESEMLSKLLDYSIKHIKQHIFTLNYHPAHARQSNLYAGGTFSHFSTALDIIAERDINILTMQDVFVHTNQSEAL